jgi:ribosomal protein L40E
MFGKKVKEITIQPSNEFCVWNVNLDKIAYNCKLNVGAGCQAIYIKNGNVAARPYQTRGLINEKKEKKLNNRLQLIAVNFDKIFDIYFGNCITYRDDKGKVINDARIGINGQIKTRLTDAWVLYKKLGNKDLTAEYINDVIREVIANIACNVVASYHESHTFGQLEAIKSKIEQETLDKIDKALGDYGMCTDGGFVLNIVLPEESKKVIAAANEEEKALEKEKRQKREEADSRMQDMMLMREISKMGEKKAKACVCPNCNAQIPEGTVFCPKCGSKI